MSLPYFPMYPADFEADTSHLTLEEDGAYNRLLRLLWMAPGCTLPSDPAWLARRLRVDAETYARVVAPLIVEFFKVEKGRLFNPRLSREFEAVSDTHAKRVFAGKKGGRPANSLKSNETEQSPAKPGPKQPEPEPYKKDSEAKASAQTPPAIVEIDPAKVAWDTGRAMLSAVGMSSAQAGQFLGKLGKDHGRAVLIEAIGVTYRTGPPDPRAFLAATCQSIAKRAQHAEPAISRNAAAHDATLEFARDLERQLGRSAPGFG